MKAISDRGAKMKKRALLSVLLCVVVLFSAVVLVSAAEQTKLLTVTTPLGGDASVYVDGVYLAEAPLSRQVKKGAEIKVVASSGDFMFFSDINGNTFGYSGTYVFEMAGNTAIDVWCNGTNDEKVCIIYQNTNSSRQILTAASYLKSNLEANFTEHSIDSANNFGYAFSKWNKTVDEIIAEAATSNVVVVEPVYTELPTTYTVNVVGGTITTENATGGEFAINTMVNLKANEAASGQKFAYWTNSQGVIISDSAEVSIAVIADDTFTANFVAESEVVELTPSVTLGGVFDKALERIITSAQRFVPDGYTLQGYGLVYSKDVKYNADDMTLENVDDVSLKMSYNGDPQSKNGIWINRISCENFVCVRAYIIYSDAEGNSYTVYSNYVNTDVDYRVSISPQGGGIAAPWDE